MSNGPFGIMGHDNGEMIVCRPEVVAFAIEMEKKLRENDHKPGWHQDHHEALLNRTSQELCELVKSCELGTDYEVVAEAADVANFVMFIADNRMKWSEGHRA